MASGIPIQAGSSGNLANVDANGNLAVNPPTLANQAGIVALGSVVSDGVLYPTNAPRQVRELKSTDDSNLRVAIPTVLSEFIFPGLAVDTGAWSQLSATMTIAQTGGFVTLNSGSSLATSVYAILKSYKAFEINQDAETTFTALVQFAAVPHANTTMEVGLFYATTTSAPTDGVLFRINGAGNFIAVTNFNGTEQTLDLGSAPAAATTYNLQIICVGDTAYFLLGTYGTTPLALVGTLSIPTAGAATTASFYAPACFRIYNGGSAPAVANQISVAQVRVVSQDYSPMRDYRAAQSAAGQFGLQGQVGATLGSLANYVNSTVPASGTLSNTAAGFATLGGQWQFAAVAGAETDYALFAYLVPAGTSSIPGKTFMVTGVRIDSINTGAAVATSSTVLQWSLGVGCTGVNLATADGAGTKARRVAVLGYQTFAIGAAIGASPLPGAIDHAFSTPLPANQGEYIHVILKMPLGTATASQVIRGVCLIEGYWE